MIEDETNIEETNPAVFLLKFNIDDTFDRISELKKRKEQIEQDWLATYKRLENAYAANASYSEALAKLTQ